MASPRAPPSERMKLRADITTARSALLECACAATSAENTSVYDTDEEIAYVLGWKTQPTAKPSKARITAIFASDVVRPNRR